MAGTAAVVAGTELRWDTIYVPGGRKIIRRELHLEPGGHYTMVRKQPRGAISRWRLSWTPAGGVAVDLGEYLSRREVDARLLEHLEGL